MHNRRLTIVKGTQQSLTLGSEKVFPIAGNFPLHRSLRSRPKERYFISAPPRAQKGHERKNLFPSESKRTSDRDPCGLAYFSLHAILLKITAPVSCALETLNCIPHTQNFLVLTLVIPKTAITLPDSKTADSPRHKKFLNRSQHIYARLVLSIFCSCRYGCQARRWMIDR